MTPASQEGAPLVLIVDDNEQNRRLTRDVLRGRRVPDARGGERRGGARARGRAPAGRDPDGPPAARHGRCGGRARCSRRGTRTARIPVVALSSVPLEDGTGSGPPGSRATSRSRSTSASSRTQVRRFCTAGMSRRGCQHPVAMTGWHGGGSHDAPIVDRTGRSSRTCDHRYVPTGSRAAPNRRRGGPSEDATRGGIRDADAVMCGALAALVVSLAACGGSQRELDVRAGRCSGRRTSGRSTSSRRKFHQATRRTTST